MTPVSRLLTIAGLLTLMVAAPVAGVAAPILLHQYRLNSSLADDLGGDSLTAHGGRSLYYGYSFDPNQGLSLSNSGISDDWSIAIDFLFHDPTHGGVGWSKILDTQDLSSDWGIYTGWDGELEVYADPNHSGSPVTLRPMTLSTLVITRNSSTNYVKAYLDGELQNSALDTNGGLISSGPLHFFMDDLLTLATLNEATSGYVDSIRIWNGVLSGQDIAQLEELDPPQIPEPASLLLVGSGLAAAGARRLRTSRRTGA